MRLPASLLLLGALALAEGDLAKARQKVRALESELAEVVGGVAPAVGAVTNYAIQFDEKTGRLVPQPRGRGSGVTISRDGLFLTNVHVVAGAGLILVAFADGRELRAVLEADTSGEGPNQGDIALLRLRAAGLPFVDWRAGDSEKLEPGSFVFAMGNPYGHAQDGVPAASLGIVSGKGRAAAEAGYLYIDALQTDAEINPGNSGGPLFDARGRLVGINGLMKSRAAGSNTGVGFAIPINQIRLFLSRMLKEGGADVAYGYHGLTVESTPGEDGVLVTAVDTEGPAARAGITRGVVITQLNAKKIRNRTEFLNLVGRLPENSVVTVVYTSGRSFDTARFRLAAAKAAPRRDGQPGPDPFASDPAYLGAEYRETGSGLSITRVTPGAGAARAGLRPGDILRGIDGAEVATGKHLAFQLKSRPAGAKVTLTVFREGKEVRLPGQLSDVVEALGGLR